MNKEKNKTTLTAAVLIIHALIMLAFILFFTASVIGVFTTGPSVIMPFVMWVLETIITFVVICLGCGAICKLFRIDD